MKKGFTLIELLVVVIIIGILATFAVPQYFKAVERAKVGKAKNSLALIVKANKLYFAENDAYLAQTDLQLAAGALNNYIEMTDIGSPADTDWSYASDAAGAATATRTGGGTDFNGKTVILNANGTWGAGTHPLD